MLLLIQKKARRLTLLGSEGETLYACRAALGRSPVGPKKESGDGKTPEGDYFVCLKKHGKYGPSLGVSYPGEQDALRAGADDQTLACIRERTAKGERPPWGSTLGGEIFIHGGGADSDWTAGCVALDDRDAEALFHLVPMGTKIRIVP